MMSDLVTRWAQRDRVREAAMSTSAARDLVARYEAPRPKPPINLAARSQAGFSPAELAWLEAQL